MKYLIKYCAMLLLRNWQQYRVGTITNLTVSAGAAVTWQNQGGVSSGAGLSSKAGLGISYTNGVNTGWIRAW